MLAATAPRDRHILTAYSRAPTIGNMDLFDEQQSGKKVTDLSGKLETLLGLCAQLKEENQSLRQQQSQLMTERAALIEKNEQARSRVEAMVSRLKSMEDNAP